MRNPVTGNLKDSKSPRDVSLMLSLMLPVLQEKLYRIQTVAWPICII